jgi:hypothetical protein
MRLAPQKIHVPRVLGNAASGLTMPQQGQAFASIRTGEGVRPGSIHQFKTTAWIVLLRVRVR